MELYDVYPLLPVNIVRGRGCKVWDDRGQEYLDLYGGHAVISIGHCHPHYIEALSAQMQQLGFYSNSVINRLQQQLAQRLGEACGYPDYRLFLINSGAEANENALKLASFHTGRSRILSLQKAFHGRTSLAVEATDNKKIVAPVNDCGHVTFLPLNDLEAWRTELLKGDVAACIIECIQGVGGIRLVSADFYRGLRQLCTETGTVLICDEIQCGYGRSGRFFAHQHLFAPEERADMAPDLITVAKGIANGFPMGALLVGPQFEAVYGQLGTTFGGNHMACAAALAVLDVMESERLVENARRVGDYLMQEISRIHSPKITEVRGCGLMIGIELDEPYREIRNRLLTEQHCFTGCAGTNTLRLLPPLCLTQQEAAEFVEKLRAVL
ncbi:MAG: aminotransferase class III-fold pyridoxal phosphate-dependent enzyme [Bacteroidaceae bacterium]|nr:aminotransferase class III-fold pyridoxal phosphate-dependent enzyme [Bacteroidaceae bacterium]